MNVFSESLFQWAETLEYLQIRFRYHDLISFIVSKRSLCPSIQRSSSILSSGSHSSNSMVFMLNSISWCLSCLNSQSWIPKLDFIFFNFAVGFLVLSNAVCLVMKIQLHFKNLILLHLICCKNPFFGAKLSFFFF